MISRVPGTRPERYRYGCSAAGSMDASINPRIRRAAGGLSLAMKRMMHARKPAALRLWSVAFFSLGNDRVHFRHYLVMGNAGARIIERGLHLGAEPAVIAGCLFFGFKFRDDGG